MAYFFLKSIIPPTLDSFLAEVALLQEQMNSKEDSSDYVNLMTFHAAKGLRV